MREAKLAKLAPQVVRGSLYDWSELNRAIADGESGVKYDCGDADSARKAYTALRSTTAAHSGRLSITMVGTEIYVTIGGAR